VARLTGAANVFAAEVATMPPPAAVPGSTDEGRLACAGEEDPEPVVLEVAAAGVRLLAVDSGRPLPRQVDVCVRPEAIAVQPVAEAATSPNHLQARIVDEVATAAHVTLYCQVQRSADGHTALELEVLVPILTYQALRLCEVRECMLVIPSDQVYLIPRAATSPAC
jgi:hypothetical protein